jgi:diguanylate cyclase (GGDEF)-like protein/PAS domain S-box-containing protein
MASANAGLAMAVPHRWRLMGSRDGYKAAATLAFATAAFDAFPGAAMVIGPGRALSPLNGAAALLLAECGEKLGHALAGAGAETLGAGQVLVRDLDALPGREVTLLPLAEARALVLIRDTALAHNLRDALIESRQRYKGLVEIFSDFAWETDEAGRFVFVSAKGVLGWTADALLGKVAADFLAEPGEANLFATREPRDEAEIWFRGADGGSARFAVSAVPLEVAGRYAGARGVCRDLTAARARDDALARAQLRDRLFTHLLRAMRDELEPDAALAAALKATGLALGAVGGLILRLVAGRMVAMTSWGEMTVGIHVDRIGGTLRDADGVTLALGAWHVIGCQARYRKETQGAIALWRDQQDGAFPEPDRALLADVADQLGVAIAQVAQHERMLLLSRTDPLTGLLNRRAFFEELERRFRRLERSARTAALLYIDLDNFKQVNDCHGHRVGDDAIRELCRLLQQNSRSGDLAARLGGDEFALWIEGLDRRTGRERAEALLAAAGVLAKYSGEIAHPLGISVGLALAEPPLSETPEQFVARADAAMYRAKQSGKGTIVEAIPAGTAAA